MTYFLYSLRKDGSIKVGSGAKSECEPIKHVFFHKKHKCASTAMRFIFQQYSHRHGLVGMKPAINHFIGGYPGPFDPRFVAKRYDMYDINVNHVRYEG